MSNLKGNEYKQFEAIKVIREDGSEFWNARALMQVLDYNKWENFSKVIHRAMIACENSGHSLSDDFPEVRKIVSAGATAKSIVDYELSRYARDAGVISSKEFAVFQNAGYMGLYGGLDVDDIHTKKGWKSVKKYWIIWAAQN